MSRRSDIVPRLDPAAVAGKDFHVREIALEMSKGTWHQYRSAVEWAAKHGLAESTVADYAKDASRLLRLGWSDEGARVLVMERISQLGQDAVLRREEYVGKDGQVRSLLKPDFKSAVHAAEVLASILGMTRHTQELRVTYERMSDEQLMAEAVKFLELREAQLPQAALEHEKSNEQQQVTVEVVTVEHGAGDGDPGVGGRDGVDHAHPAQHHPVG